MKNSMRHIFLFLLLSSRIYGQYIEPIDSLPMTPPTASEQPSPIVLCDIITRNGDGFNDFLEIRNLELYDNTRLTIYNRWGGVVHRATNYQNDWDGGNVPDGVYFYVVEIILRDRTDYCVSDLTIIK